jgi:hypothetical protein
VFRVKIALLSVLLSGSVLVGLGLYSLFMINNLGMARMDREILTLGEGHLATRPPRSYWQNFEASLIFIYGEEWSKNLIVQIKDSADVILFKSSHWPTEVTEDSFPDFDRVMDNRPPLPNERTGEERVSNPRFGLPAGAQEHLPSNQGNDVRRDHRGPPPEAYKVCEGKSAGSVAQFVNRRGETLKGTCEEEDGRLVLRPDANKGKRRGEAHNTPRGRSFFAPRGESNPPEWRIPRMKKSHILRPYKHPRECGGQGSWAVTALP